MNRKRQCLRDSCSFPSNGAIATAMSRLAPLAAMRFAVGLLAASVKPTLLSRLLSLGVAPNSAGFWLALLESLWTSGYIAAVRRAQTDALTRRSCR